MPKHSSHLLPLLFPWHHKAFPTLGSAPCKQYNVYGFDTNITPCHSRLHCSCTCPCCRQSPPQLLHLGLLLLPLRGPFHVLHQLLLIVNILPERSLIASWFVVASIYMYDYVCWLIDFMTERSFSSQTWVPIAQSMLPEPPQPPLTPWQGRRGWGEIRAVRGGSLLTRGELL